MAEERNPYFEQTTDTVDGQPTYPQQPQYQQPTGYYQQPEQPPQYPQQQYPQQYPQQPYYGYAQKQPGGGAAKAFAVISFVVGCFSLLFALFGLIILADGRFARNAAATVLALSFVYGIALTLPGMIFGIVSVAKKTRLMALGVLGVIFNLILLLEMLLSLILIL